ncbi:MAG: SirB2 family protein [Betaproteobacteria bacterium]
MDYFSIKIVHVTCVIISYALFVLRGVWMMRRPALLQLRWMKIVPNAVDTLLLVSAVLLTMLIHQYPFVNAWLTAKVLGLLLYIALGMSALRFGQTRGARLAAWLAAQAVFFYIVAVAVTHRPLPLPG